MSFFCILKSLLNKGNYFSCHIHFNSKNLICLWYLFGQVLDALAFTYFLPSSSSKNVFLLICSKFDLYSKSDSVPDVEAVSPYYEELIAKYCPGELLW